MLESPCEVLQYSLSRRGAEFRLNSISAPRRWCRAPAHSGALFHGQRGLLIGLSRILRSTSFLPGTHDWSSYRVIDSITDYPLRRLFNTFIGHIKSSAGVYK